MRFVKKVRGKRGIGIKTKETVRVAVEECISENILAGFFAEHREEIILNFLLFSHSKQSKWILFIWFII